MERYTRDFLDALESRFAYASSTRLAYDNDLRVFVSYLRQALAREPELTDFTPEQVASFLEAERLSGRRQSTLVRRRATLRRFAAYLNEEGLIAADITGPAAQLIDATVGGVVPLVKSQSLTDPELTQLWSVLEKSPRPHARRDQAILALLLETGVSVGTLVAMNMDDLVFQGDQLRLRLSGEKDILLPKGKASELIQRYLKEGRPELNHAPEEQALFISQTGERMSRQGVWQVLRRWGRVIDLPVTLSPRLARHTAVIQLVESGRSLSDIQAMLGHSNPLSTQALLRRLGVSGDHE